MSGRPEEGLYGNLASQSSNVSQGGRRRTRSEFEGDTDYSSTTRIRLEGIRRPQWTMSSTVEDILLEGSTNRTDMKLNDFLRRYLGEEWVVERNGNVTMGNFVQNPETFIKKKGLLHIITTSLSYKELEAIYKLHHEGVSSLEEWRDYEGKDTITPFPRGKLNGVLTQVLTEERREAEERARREQQQIIFNLSAKIEDLLFKGSVRVMDIKLNDFLTLELDGRGILRANRNVLLRDFFINPTSHIRDAGVLNEIQASGAYARMEKTVREEKGLEEAVRRLHHEGVSSLEEWRDYEGKDTVTPFPRGKLNGVLTQVLTEERREAEERARREQQQIIFNLSAKIEDLLFKGSVRVMDIKLNDFLTLELDGRGILRANRNVLLRDFFINPTSHIRDAGVLNEIQASGAYARMEKTVREEKGLEEAVRRLHHEGVSSLEEWRDYEGKDTVTPFPRGKLNGVLTQVLTEERREAEERARREQQQIIFNLSAKIEDLLFKGSVRVMDIKLNDFLTLELDGRGILRANRNVLLRDFFINPTSHIRDAGVLNEIQASGAYARMEKTVREEKGLEEAVRRLHHEGVSSLEEWRDYEGKDTVTPFPRGKLNGVLTQVLTEERREAEERARREQQQIIFNLSAKIEDLLFKGSVRVMDIKLNDFLTLELDGRGILRANRNVLLRDFFINPTSHIRDAGVLNEIQASGAYARMEKTVREEKGLEEAVRRLHHEGVSSLEEWRDYEGKDTVTPFPRGKLNGVLTQVLTEERREAEERARREQQQIIFNLSAKIEDLLFKGSVRVMDIKLNDFLTLELDGRGILRANRNVLLRDFFINPTSHIRDAGVLNEIQASGAYARMEKTVREEKGLEEAVRRLHHEGVSSLEEWRDYEGKDTVTPFPRGKLNGVLTQVLTEERREAEERARREQQQIIFNLSAKIEDLLFKGSVRVMDIKLNDFLTLELDGRGILRANRNVLLRDFFINPTSHIRDAGVLNEIQASGAYARMEKTVREEKGLEEAVRRLHHEGVSSLEEWRDYEGKDTVTPFPRGKLNGVLTQVLTEERREAEERARREQQQIIFNLSAKIEDLLFKGSVRVMDIKLNDFLTLELDGRGILRANRNVLLRDFFINPTSHIRDAGVLNEIQASGAYARMEKTVREEKGLEEAVRRLHHEGVSSLEEWRDYEGKDTVTPFPRGKLNGVLTQVLTEERREAEERARREQQQIIFNLSAKIEDLLFKGSVRVMDIKLNDFLTLELDGRGILRANRNVLLRDFFINPTSHIRDAGVLNEIQASGAYARMEKTVREEKGLEEAVRRLHHEGVSSLEEWRDYEGKDTVTPFPRGKLNGVLTQVLTEERREAEERARREQQQIIFNLSAKIEDLLFKGSVRVMDIKLNDFLTLELDGRGILRANRNVLLRDFFINPTSHIRDAGVLNEIQASGAYARMEKTVREEKGLEEAVRRLHHEGVSSLEEWRDYEGKDTVTPFPRGKLNGVLTQVLTEERREAEERARREQQQIIFNLSAKIEDLLFKGSVRVMDIKLNDFLTLELDGRGILRANRNVLLRDFFINPTSHIRDAGVLNEIQASGAYARMEKTVREEKGLEEAVRRLHHEGVSSLEEWRDYEGKDTVTPFPRGKLNGVLTQVLTEERREAEERARREQQQIIFNLSAKIEDLLFKGSVRVMDIKLNDFLTLELDGRGILRANRNVLLRDFFINPTSHIRDAGVLNEIQASGAYARMEKTVREEKGLEEAVRRLHHEGVSSLEEWRDYEGKDTVTPFPRGKLNGVLTQVLTEERREAEERARREQQQIIFNLSAKIEDLLFKGSVRVMDIKLNDFLTLELDGRGILRANRNVLLRDFFINPTSHIRDAGVLNEIQASGAYARMEKTVREEKGLEEAVRRLHHEGVSSLEEWRDYEGKDTITPFPRGKLNGVLTQVLTEERREAEERARREQQQIIFNLSAKIEDLLFKGSVRVMDIKLNDFLTLELDGRGILRANRNVLLRDFFINPTSHIRDAGVLNEIQASGAYARMEKTVREEKGLEEAVRRLHHEGVSSLEEWRDYEGKDTVTPFPRGKLNGVLTQVLTEERREAEERARREQQQIIFNLSAKIEDLLFKGSVRVMDIKLNDFLTLELDGRGILRANRNVLLRDFFINPTSHIRDAGVLNEIQASGAYARMEKTVREEKGLEEAVRRLHHEGVSSLEEWRDYEGKDTVTPFPRGKLNGVLTQVLTEERREAEERARREQQQIIFNLSAKIEDLLFKGSVRVMDIKLNDFLTLELDGRGILRANRNVLLRDFFINPTSHIRDAGVLNEIQASGAYARMEKTVREEKGLEEDIRKLQYNHLSNLVGWSLATAEIRASVRDNIKSFLDAALEEARNPTTSAPEKLQGCYESVYNASWHHVVEVPGGERTGMEVREGKPPQSWKYRAVGGTLEKDDGVEQSSAERLRLMVLTWDDGWPYTMNGLHGAGNDLCVNCEVERVWQIVKRGPALTVRPTLSPSDVC
ncbi:putative retrotransposon hot spot (RHS) protein [Trypanosoma cruzi]|uniref:Putative retrotransposon hot spot (RHS) protein n=1 Tax=Trypanosoma cruzi TaxID=5693 RepID=A0A2V2UPM6_TRYCR|nr:putative retrotransposon hot spot (RHS) protein [Trypanosoma cruzi]